MLLPAFFSKSPPTPTHLQNKRAHRACTHEKKRNKKKKKKHMKIAPVQAAMRNKDEEMQHDKVLYTFTAVFLSRSPFCFWNQA